MSRPALNKLACLLLVAALPAVSAAADGTTMTVVPLVPLFSAAPQSLGDRGAAAIAEQLGWSGRTTMRAVAEPGAQLVRGAASEAEISAARQRVEEVGALLTQAAELSRGGAQARAAKLLDRAVSQLLADFHGLHSIEPLSDALVQLAQTRLAAGSVEDARGALRELARLDPERTPDAPALASLHSPLREALLSGSRGTLRVASVSFGAQVSVDGREVGETPLLVRDLLPGRHFVRVLRPGFGAAWRWVAIEPGQETTFDVELLGTAGGALATLASELSQNRFSAQALSSAKSVGLASQADYVVAGVLLPEKGALRAYTFIVRAADGAFATLRPLTFDLEMLGASVEAAQLVEELEARLGEFKPPARQLPFALVAEARPPPASAREVRITPLPRAPEKEEPASDPPPEFVRLKRGTPRTVDEDAPATSAPASGHRALLWTGLGLAAALVAGGAYYALSSSPPPAVVFDVTWTP